MPENEQRIFGRGGFHPTRQSPPVLLYTPDGVTLQDRTTGKPRGTLTQYKYAHNYLWEYTTHTKPHHCTYILRVWIIDPMPEADALALARAICNAETAAKRFADFCAGWGVRKLDEMSAGRAVRYSGAGHTPGCDLPHPFTNRTHNTYTF